MEGEYKFGNNDGFDKLLLTEQESESLDFIFIKLNDILNKLDIKYFVSFGTLIGAIRHGRRMPWDDDIDMIISTADAKKLDEFITKSDNRLPGGKVKQWHLECGLTFGKKKWGMPYKIWQTGCFLKNETRWGFPFLDINTYVVDKDILSVPKRELKFGHIKSFSHPIDLIFPLKIADLDGHRVPVPNQPVKVLKKDFGDDVLDICKVAYNHKHTSKMFKKLYENDRASDIVKFNIPFEKFEHFNAKNHRWSGVREGKYCDELFYD